MTFKICQGIAKPVLQQLSFFLKEKSTRWREVLFREDDIAAGIYFILDGEFEVTKRLEKEEKTINQAPCENLDELKLGLKNPQATRYQ
jgi:CRP-like cAMP-binding protein